MEGMDAFFAAVISSFSVTHRKQDRITQYLAFMNSRSQAPAVNVSKQEMGSLVQGIKDAFSIGSGSSGGLKGCGLTELVQGAWKQ